MWNVLKIVMGCIMISCVVLDISNVVGRYVLLSPIIWAEEVLGFLLVWGVFVGVVMVTKDDNHLTMNLLSSLGGEKFQRVMRVLKQAATAGISILVTVKSAELVVVIAKTNETSVAAGLPMMLVYCALPIGFGLMGAISAYDLIRSIVFGKPIGDSA